ncbi:uncharacterized protein B0I36DRAFT_21314 [Microdochium trichocladiopsis]|uniref:Uncharacterized protein n=1 Tax=Microdochium trichocladiopsis TaxID=1682393 RepID=A0A9P9BX68_9PEZI|nr:uncharacterized protein B0I36DRAFT_21314 [Microdochium trichocladiopsis]KAH7041280.1 hypothetical protein B0I36DRAFT_21314 [Microdochium trichocladiopsis]
MTRRTACKGVSNLRRCPEATPQLQARRWSVLVALVIIASQPCVWQRCNVGRKSLPVGSSPKPSHMKMKTTKPAHASNIVNSLPSVLPRTSCAGSLSHKTTRYSNCMPKVVSWGKPWRACMHPTPAPLVSQVSRSVMGTRTAVCAGLPIVLVDRCKVRMFSAPPAASLY